MDLDALFRALATSDDTAYVLSRDRRIVRTNDGWARFAAANGGDPIITAGHDLRLDDVLPEALRELFVTALERALATGQRWEHEYECSSADLYRRFRLVVYPVDGEHLLCVHSRLVEHPHVMEAADARASTYAVGGVITTCSHCRRIKNPQGISRWDWVPAFVAAPPPNLSHGLCEPCFEFYYGLDEP